MRLMMHIIIGVPVPWCSSDITPSEIAVSWFPPIWYLYTRRRSLEAFWKESESPDVAETSNEEKEAQTASCGPKKAPQITSRPGPVEL